MILPDIPAEYMDIYGGTVYHAGYNWIKLEHPLPIDTDTDKLFFRLSDGSVVQRDIVELRVDSRLYFSPAFEIPPPVGICFAIGTPGETVIKPPLGLIPRHIWEQERLTAIKEAVARYIEAGKPIPAQWIVEYYELPGKEKEPLLATGGKVEKNDSVANLSAWDIMLPCHYANTYALARDSEGNVQPVTITINNHNPYSIDSNSTLKRIIADAIRGK